MYRTLQKKYVVVSLVCLFVWLSVTTIDVICLVHEATPHKCLIAYETKIQIHRYSLEILQTIANL